VKTGYTGRIAVEGSGPNGQGSWQWE
jgi:hypothetical protein